MESTAGKLLVAIPELPDSNFFRSVVFVVEHSAEGAMGVILNRPTDIDLSQLWRKLDPSVEVTSKSKVHVGGPVSGPIIALHDHFSLSDELVIEDVYISTDSDRLNGLVINSDVRFRVFSGYSGWGPGQLDLEWENGGWLVADATARDVYSEPDDLWKAICERVGNKIMFPGLPDSPLGDPNMN